MMDRIGASFFKHYIQPGIGFISQKIDQRCTDLFIPVGLMKDITVRILIVFPASTLRTGKRCDIVIARHHTAGYGFLNPGRSSRRINFRHAHSQPQHHGITEFLPFGNITTVNQISFPPGRLRSVKSSDRFFQFLQHCAINIFLGIVFGRIILPNVAQSCL